MFVWFWILALNDTRAHDVVYHKGQFFVETL